MAEGHGGAKWLNFWQPGCRESGSEPERKGPDTKHAPQTHVPMTHPDTLTIVPH